MSFNESNVNRDSAGKFDHKLGTAPDQELPAGVGTLNEAAARIREEGVTDEVRQAIEPYLDEREDEAVILALMDVGEAAVEAGDEEYAWHLADRLGWLDETETFPAEDATTAYTVPYDFEAEAADADYSIDTVDVPVDAQTATFELPADGVAPQNVPARTDAPAPSDAKPHPIRSTGSAPARMPRIPPGRFERFLALLGNSLLQSIRFR